MSTERAWRVLVPPGVHERGFEVLREFADVSLLSDYPDHDSARAAIAGDEYDAVVVRNFVLDRETLDASDRLRVISKHGVGLDNVDVAAASENGVLVTRTPGQNVQAVAEHAIGLLFAVRKQFLPATGDMRSGEWDRERYVGPELRGDVLGIYGLGAIGERVASLAHALGMEVVARDPYVGPGDVADWVDLVETVPALCDAADALTVHAPLTEETAGAIGESHLRRLPPSGVVVNCARGGIVDEGALASVLDEGAVAGAGLDVFETEPPGGDHPLVGRRNVVTTPHCAGSTAESMRGMAELAAENVRAALAGETPEHTVNAESLDGR
jgi:D-3-phosphoglycerate dehydrogenase